MKITMENSQEESEITMDDVRNLIKKKDNIEEQIKAYYEVLEDVSLTYIWYDLWGLATPPSKCPGRFNPEAHVFFLDSKVSGWKTL